MRKEHHEQQERAAEETEGHFSSQIQSFPSPDDEVLENEQLISGDEMREDLARKETSE